MERGQSIIINAFYKTARLQRKMNHNYLPQVMEICGHTFIADFIDSNSMVVDLGANDGIFTEKIYSTFGCSIFAVEPVPQLFSKIKADEKVKKFNYCIAGKNEPIKLNTWPNKCASIYQHDDGTQNQSIVVHGMTFDYFLKAHNIKNIDLLKVDIEGAEIELFSSLSTEHLRVIKQITIEFHDFMWEDMHDQVELIKLKMISNGFYCIPFSLNNGNVLFVRAEMIANSRYKRMTYFYLNFLKYMQGLRRILKRRIFL